ncbi:FtsQ-type POTRA domain-containing protein [Pseudoflavonifractor sp. MCC625]|uniref:cell division protein FtsQ/DivIB n=1 Tax=Pseudoflavonifractor sp. MCC625 TaxID=2592647 RepID=UPI001C03797E|nr:FtsQ-type POTRA domain-containing protein [Pseudoflavonifractor sp. MCC625]
MAARRKRRGRRRRGRFGILYKVLSFFLILAAIVTGCIVFFRVNEIVVVGETRYSEAEIIAATGVEQGENLFQLNKFDMAHKVLTQLPYVDEITISRKLPDTLVLKVTESTPVAVLESGGNWWLLDVRGKLLEQGDASLAQGRAVLTGLDPLSPAVGGKLAVGEEQQKKLESLMALFNALQARGMAGQVTEFIDLTAENVVRFGYGGTLTVEMPLFDDFGSQTWRLQRALEELSARNGTVSGTLHLPSEGNKAWLLAQRWMPGDETESSSTGEESTASPSPSPSPAPEA